MLTLLLSYERNGRAVPLARSNNPALLRAAAEAALAEKREEVLRLESADQTLGLIGRTELNQMNEVLGALGLIGHDLCTQVN